MVTCFMLHCAACSIPNLRSAVLSGDREAQPMGSSPDQVNRANQDHRANLDRKRKSSRKKKQSDSESDENLNRRRQSRKHKRRYKNHSSSDSETERSDESSDEDEERAHRHRSSKSTLKVIRPLNDVFRKAADYRTYRLDKTGNKYPASHKSIRSARKSLDVQMSRITYTGSDSIAILGFLTLFRNACNHNGVSEGKAVWVFQHYLAGRALHLIQSRMTGNSLVVDDDENPEVLSTYCEVVNFLLKTFATNEVIAAAYADLTSFVQATGTTETEYGDELWDKAIRCGSVISQTRLRSMFAEGVQTSIRAQVRNHLATHPRMSFDDLARYAQALGDSLRAARKPAPAIGFRKPDTGPVKPRRNLLTVDSESMDSVSLQGEDHSTVLAFSQAPSLVRSSSISTSSGYSTQEAIKIPAGPTPPSSAPSVNQAPVGTPRVRMPPKGAPTEIGVAPGTFCWFCLSQEHSPSQFPLLPESVREQMLNQRNANFRALTSQGLNPLTGKPRAPRPDTTMVALTEAPEETNMGEDASPQSGTTYHTAAEQEN